MSIRGCRITVESEAEVADIGIPSKLEGSVVGGNCQLVFDLDFTRFGLVKAVYMYVIMYIFC